MSCTVSELRRRMTTKEAAQWSGYWAYKNARMNQDLEMAKMKAESTHA